MDDLISRQAAIDELDKGLWGVEWDKALAEAMIKSVPSAEPERKKGRWMPFDNPWYQCSECGAVRKNESFMENFCPNCGARMEK